MDIDAAGGLATAGLVGAAIERPAGEAGEDHGTCTDCGAPAPGRFCPDCGQPTHIHRSLLHLGEEMLHGVLHFDARIWRTLPLLAINPGRLTREWVQGKRTRYVSPLAIFLFTVFMMFFVLSFTSALEHKVEHSLSQDIAETRANLEVRRDRLRELKAGPQTPETAEDIADAVRRIHTRERRLAQMEQALTTGGLRPDGLRPGSWQARVRDQALSGQNVINLGYHPLDKAMNKKLLNPDLAVYKLQQATYKYSFLLIPLSIPFVALLFLWRRGFTLYDHGVFVLYSLTAMSILVMVTGALAPLWEGFAILTMLAFMIGVPVHMFAQLKGAYGLPSWSAGWRTALLLIFCVVILTLFVVTVTVLGLSG